MPLFLQRHDDADSVWKQPHYSVFCGGLGIGGFSLHTQGRRPFWSWGASGPFGRANGCADTPHEARDFLARSWRAQLAAADIEEIPDLPKRIGTLAGPAPNSAHLDPFPYKLARDHGNGASAHPEDQYVVLQAGHIVGMLLHDPSRDWHPKVIRDRWPKPWMWYIHQRPDHSGITLCGNVGSLDEAREQHAVAWRRWLAWAGMRERS